MARPTLLNDLTAEEICASVEAGLPIEQAAAGAGIGSTTVFRWLARGRDYTAAVENPDGPDPDPADEPFREFWERLQKARAAFVHKGLRKIAAAGEEPRHWQAWAWLLERRFPTQFARNVARPVDDGETIPTLGTADDLEAERDALLAEVDRLAERLAADNTDDEVPA